MFVGRHGVLELNEACVRVGVEARLGPGPAF